jgi:hypothetical protein
MKYLRTGGLVVLAAAVAMALVGAGTASATVLCKVKETPCAAANEYPKGTVADGSLPAGVSAKMLTTDGTVVMTCTAATIKGTLEVAGGPTETPHSSSSGATLNWSGCTQTMDTIKNGTIEIHHIAGTYNGTVIIKGVETTVNILGASCVYTYGSGVDVGVLTSGTQPKMDINGVLTKTATSPFICPTTVKGQTEGVLTEPHELPVYVMDE